MTLRTHRDRFVVDPPTMPIGRAIPGRRRRGRREDLDARPLPHHRQVRGINDTIANILTAGMHLTDGHFVEAGWDNYFYTRQWNTPLEVNIHIVDSGAPEPGGIGEFGVAATGAAVANA